MPEDRDQQALELEPEDVQAQSRGAPWNPDAIRVTTKPYSLRHISDMIEDQELDLEPDFQRADVWKDGQRSRLIESILLRIPLPSFYFDEDREGKLQVVDGVQRLGAIHDFARKKFKLSGLRYLGELEGKSFDDIGSTLKRRFEGTQIFANVIDPQTPPNVKFDIFLRLNTGGTPLSAQEIRHCISRNPSRQLLKRCVELPEFHLATGGSFKDRTGLRMADRELALRFFAFSQPDWGSAYRSATSLDQFLFEMTSRLDDATPETRATAVTTFSDAMRKAWTVFEGNAFRKWPEGARQRFPINRSLFESWSVALLDFPLDRLIRSRDAIQRETRRRMTDDEEYSLSFTVATGDLRRIETRLRIAREILQTATA